MNNELIINASGSDVTIALMQDKRLLELNRDKKEHKFSVGDIYLGKVKKIMPGLNAAFVDVGYNKDAFLHYFDLGPQIKSLLKFTKLATNQKLNSSLLDDFELESDIIKTGKMSDVLSANQWIPVQIAKEPISSKGPRLSSEFSLAGRYIVLVPFSNIVSISQKIKSSEERSRLKRLATSIKPKNFGIIIRTVASGKKVAELDNDIRDLMVKWNTLYQKLCKAKPNHRLLGEMDRTTTILRDSLNPNFNAIHVDDNDLAEEIKNYIKTIAPEQESIVKHFKGRNHIFDHFGVNKQIKNLFGKTVNMTGGTYLVIEHTEALHVIDVNSGGRKAKGESDSQSNAINVNKIAAKEIARQLRLRDMGGIIVVDFIDMHNAAHKKDLFQTIKNELKEDKAKHSVLPPSKFGLVQITRQRVRPETNITTVEKCPACKGSGEVKATVLFIDEIENNIRYLVEDQNEKNFSITVHPYIAAYILKGFFSLRYKWYMKYKRWINVKADNSYHMLQYHFFNKNGEEIII
ncbi:MAG TPA: Rne/Rng family ribonuclease [Bacteroidia bacterium]|nr:Rne/Rng family ribonuclease [Bacteroidia bacterium]HNT79062.1 Rne/Rng family ribonuclease [Bacteroidia bacterium]